jgi:choline monooxygenase
MITSLHNITESDLLIHPIERAETLSSRFYFGDTVHTLEREHLFARQWQYVGHRSQLQNPGDQIIATVAENPILIVMGDDRVLRAFYNVCRHRGGPLATENCHSSMLQCKYHGWTYRLDGSLRGTPRFNRVDLFDRKDFGLYPVFLDEWEGLLFVSLTRQELSVAHSCAGIADRIAPERLTEKKFARRVVYDVKCNWKAYVDNYLEGYHVPYVHPELCDLLDLQEYMTETSKCYSLQYSPLKPNETVYGTGQAFYYFLYPNFMLNILPGRLQTNLVLPVSPTSCRVIFDFYYNDIKSPDARKRMEEDVAYSDKVQQEDIEICEHVQRGLESRVYTTGRFSPETEQGVYHFQSLLKQHYRTALQSVQE